MAYSFARSAFRARWLLLYALLPLCVTLLVIADGIPWTSRLRELVEIVIIGLVIGLAAVWVNLNRRALAGTDVQGLDGGATRQDTIVQFKAPSPQVIHLNSHRHDS